MALPAIAGAAAVAAIGWKVLSGPKGHDGLVKKTHKQLQQSAGESTSVYVDHHHYSDSAAGNTRGLDLGINSIPDHVVQSPPGSPNLIVEVETSDSLDSDAEEQLEEFRLQGYKRVLVVPSSAADDAEAFVGDLDGQISVTTPSDVVELVS
jgi:hypothetical protein